MSHWEVFMVQAMNTEQRQVAANLWTKSIGLSHKPLYIGCQ